MDTYHIWVDLKDSHRDVQFAGHVEAYLAHLQQEGLLRSYRLTRRKLGFGPPELGEFHIAIDTDDLAQLERCFQNVATRSGEVQKLHAAVYGSVTNFRAALYRDFPDAVRAR